jgi:hydroxymethylbilane synthase
MIRLITLGTRASALAMAQTELTRAALLRAFPSLEVRVETFVTQGDRKLDLDMLQRTPGGGKGLFTRELEEALLDGRIDLAVHSLKDLPGHMPAGLELVAVLERAATADVLLSKYPGGLEGLPQRALVGTSSIRRARQLGWLRPDLEVGEWRGNVQTRLRKLGEHLVCAGIVLAQAGLDRLGFGVASGEVTFEQWTFHAAPLGGSMYPAIGQGVIALQAASARAEVRELAGAINHAQTWVAVRAERELQRRLAGDCTLPVGVRTRQKDGVVEMDAVLFVEGRSEPVAGRASGVIAEDVAASVARQLGGEEPALGEGGEGDKKPSTGHRAP